MREEYKPGDLSVRMAFATVMGMGPDRGKICPRLQITDETSGLSLEIEISAVQLTEMLSGSSAQVPAARVTGHRGVKLWGKYLKITTRSVDTKSGDYKYRDNARELEHVNKLATEMEADGWQCDTPRWGNGGKWVITGRRYDDKP